MKEEKYQGHLVWLIQITRQVTHIKRTQYIVQNNQTDTGEC